MRVMLEQKTTITCFLSRTSDKQIICFAWVRHSDLTLDFWQRGPLAPHWLYRTSSNPVVKLTSNYISCENGGSTRLPTQCYDQ